MRHALAPAGLLLALVMLAGPHARAQTPAAPSAKSAPEQTTKVEGTVPDLTGRWLVLAQVAFAQGGPGGVAIPQLWTITTRDGKPAVEVRFVELPAALLDAVTAANKERRPWEPTVADLQQLRDIWSTLAPADRGVSAVGTTLSGPDAFSQETKDDERMRTARFLVQQTVAYQPAQARPIREAMVFGATETQPFGWRGNYASTTLAAAPFPIPISFAGTFQMYRLESVPARGLLERISGLFSGCGRSPQ